ncbi:ABC transporter substrate-binding protein [Luteimonas terrae]|uniref:ABC transporter substrate-binding protein n=1 Tax=Luteimonas terrae TaxID=1530191 RepID=A0ABU1XSH8_9GAMM|nr:ABC transporter substrate-binding protein [Luteimonas terrae]MDR7191712.1 hypothetical protein [Luteimonas terrae]
MVRLTLLLLCLCLVACGPYPRDARDSSDRARESMRVGLSHDPPYVVVRPGAEPSGPEVALIEAFANAHGLHVEWVVDGHEALMGDLVEHRLHMVAGGHAAKSPWTDVSWSRTFLVRDAQGRPAARRIALPPGENAWQLDVDRWLHAQREPSR